MDSASIHGEGAQFYDRIYSFKNYAQEIERLREWLHAEGVADGASVLDAACGTGEHLAGLTKWFRMSGFDVSPEMLAVARAKCPDLDLFEADMCTFRAPARYAAVLCLFSSIGYLATEERLRAAMRAFAEALDDRGLLIVEPWLTRENYTPGLATMHTYEDADVKLCRQAVAEVQGDMSVFDMHWLVARTGAKVEHFVERHELRFHEPEAMRRALEDAGFEFRFETEGLMPRRGLYVARVRTRER